MRADVPLRINIVISILRIAESLGEWALGLIQHLIDTHCRCVQCKTDKRGAYREI